MDIISPADELPNLDFNEILASCGLLSTTNEISIAGTPTKQISFNTTSLVVSITKITPAVQQVIKTPDMGLVKPNTACVSTQTECPCVCSCVTAVVTPVVFRGLSVTATSTPHKRKRLEFGEESLTSPPVNKKTRTTKGTHHWSISEKVAIVVGRRHFTDLNSTDVITSIMKEKFLMNQLKDYHQKYDAIRLGISRSATQKKFKETDALTAILIETLKKKFLENLTLNI
jgi:hypothetical protein